LFNHQWFKTMTHHPSSSLITFSTSLADISQ
jgi:hypothetical protein